MEVSNYIKMRDQMQERFLTYDQKEIEGKYGFAFDDDQRDRLHFFVYRKASAADIAHPAAADRIAVFNRA